MLCFLLDEDPLKAILTKRIPVPRPRTTFFLKDNLVQNPERTFFFKFSLLNYRYNHHLVIAN